MFKGSIPALVTPFKNGALDSATLKQLVEWHIAEGSHGLVPVGTTGESPTLSHAEHGQVIAEVVKAAAGRIPVIAGAGSNNTTEGIELIREIIQQVRGITGVSRQRDLLQIGQPIFQNRAGIFSVTGHVGQIGCRIKIRK